MKDQNFKDSIWERMGFDAEMCPKCKAHLRNGICLNGCHLSPRTLKLFQLIMSGIVAQAQEKGGE